MGARSARQHPPSSNPSLLSHRQKRRLTQAARALPLLVASVLVATMAWRAYRTEREQVRTVHQALTEYSELASWTLARRTSDYLRLVAWTALQHADTGARQAQPIHRVEAHADARCSGELLVASHWLVPPAGGAPRVIAGRPVRDAATVARDVRTHAASAPRTNMDLALVPAGRDARTIVAYRTLRGPDGRVAAWVAAELETASLRGLLCHTLTFAPITPSFLAGVREDTTLMSVVVSDADGTEWLRTAPDPAMHVASSDTLGASLAGLRVRVAIGHAAAGRLLVGGVKPSRLHTLIVLLALTLVLLAIAFDQMRRGDDLARMRESFVASVSHELRTPLTQVTLFAQTLLKHPHQPLEERERFLGIIAREALRLRHLVETVLRFSQIGRIPKPSPGATTELLEESRATIEAFRPVAAERGVRVELLGGAQVVAAIDGDAWRQLLINLLDNAVRHGPPDETVTVHIARSGSSAEVTVEDRGPGVPAHLRERVFEPFFRAAEARVTGSGIGLAVVKDIVDSHRGSISMEDAVPHGARVVVCLPLPAPGSRLSATEPWKSSGSGRPEAGAESREPRAESMV